MALLLEVSQAGFAPRLLAKALASLRNVYPYLSGIFTALIAWVIAPGPPVENADDAGTIKGVPGTWRMLPVQFDRLCPERSLRKLHLYA